MKTPDIKFIKPIRKKTVKGIILHALKGTDVNRLFNKTKQTSYYGRTWKNQELGSSRSVEDLYVLIKHYKPYTKLSTVKKAMKNMDLIKFYCISYGRYMYRLRPKYPTEYD